jgi:exodeoxyribonuclease VII large subunit
MKTTTVEELQRSKAKLVNDITQQLTANFNKQIQNLQEQLKLSREHHDRTKEDLAKTYNQKEVLYKQETQTLNQHVRTLTTQLNSQERLIKQAEDSAWFYKRQLREVQGKSGSSISRIVGIVIIALIIGVIIGIILVKR